MNALPEDLRAATVAVERTEQAVSLSDWVWCDAVKRWACHCQLTVVLDEGALIPSVTDWYVVVEENYPWGSIKFYPAKTNSIRQTFPHQSYNAVGAKNVSWRTGDICLSSEVRVLNRQGLESEPFDAYCRLRWHCLRALEWLKRAATGTLLESGAPYELPQFPISPTDHTLVAFNEDEASHTAWRASSKQIGIVDFGRVSRNPRTTIVRSFRSLTGDEIRALAWGKAISEIEVSHQGLWIRLDSCPLAGPWQAPATWGELRRAVSGQSSDLDRFLRVGLKHFRDGKPHVLLIGFAIPNLVSGEPIQLHWTAIELPALSRGSLTQNGFRPNALGHWMRDRQQLFADGREIRWQRTQNWTAAELGGRGHLPTGVAKRHIALIGGGALGSAVAELLARTGVIDVTVIDGEVMEAGNLVRHTLTLDDILMGKAQRLSGRLNAVSPHIKVTAIANTFPDLTAEEAERVQSADIIVDCTASDGVVFALSRFRWHTRKRFVSLSLGLYARRLFCFSARSRVFPLRSFHHLVEPWLERERLDYAGSELPREGIGWHPVFPARADDVWMLASVALKFLEQEITSTGDEPNLVVYEQMADASGFMGIRRASLDE